MSLDLIPMLLLSLLLLTAGEGVQTAELVLTGQHEATAQHGALIVGDAQVVVPHGAEVSGPVHVLGGQTRLAGAVDADVTHVAGTLIIEDSGEIRGTLQHIGGTLVVEPDATIGRRMSLQATPDEPGLVRRFMPVVLATGLLALIGARRTRRSPHTLAHVRNAISAHPVVSVTIGALVTVTFLSLFVFMAFTLVLLPVSLLGLLAGVVTLGYGLVGVGSLVGQHLPIERPGVATGAGIALVMAAIELLGAIPVVGSVAVGAILLTGLGAVLLTFFGLREFTPVAIPD